ncbi:MAG: hypothetical protein WC977_14670 [Anaerovoracaceae bacterium]
MPRLSMIPAWMPEEVTRYISVSLPGDCRMQCPYCLSGAHTRAGLPRVRPYSDEVVVAAWRQVAENVGPCMLAVNGLEPTTELRLLGEVCAQHYATIITNLQCCLRKFRAALDPERVEVHPSFHAHGWRSLDTFLARIYRLRADGYRVPLVAIVAYPPYIPRLAEWAARLEAEGIWPNIVAMRNATYQGREYPEGYTDDEREALSRWCSFESVHAPVPREIMCRAGIDACCVWFDGRVTRCGSMAASAADDDMGNLYEDGHIRWLTEERPCPIGYCPCGQLHALHVEP